MFPVLLTANFDQAYIEQCSTSLKNIRVEQQAFISTNTAPFSSQIQKATQVHSDLWIFTSRKAVLAFKTLYAETICKPKYVAVVGMQTKASIEALGLDVTFYSPRGSEDLMQHIGTDLKINNAHFFTGDRHLSFVQNTCKDLGIELNTLILYHTTENRVSVDLSKYKGLLFCSPSAVQSFNENYKLTQCDKALFAIGNTTAESIRNLGAENVLLAPEAKLESLLQTADAYFKR